MKTKLSTLLILTVLSAFLLMAMASGSSDESSITNSSSNSSSEKADIQETILLERDGVKITAKEMVTDIIWGDGIKLLVENSSDTDLNISCDSMIVNDFMITDMFYCTVAAGKKSNETLYLSSSDLKNSGIDNIGKIEFEFYASNNNYERIFENEYAVLETSLISKMDTSTNVEGAELYNQNNIKIIGKAVNEHDFWGSAVVLYIENNTDDEISVYCDNMSVNGFMVSPLFASNIKPNKKAVDTITLFENELEENDIESIEDIELSFRIINSDNYNIIDETAPISFSTK